MKFPLPPKPGYQERVRLQTLRWAEGVPYHNNVDNECCPDFSCCHSDMFEKDTAKRWRYYHEKYGPHAST